MLFAFVSEVAGAEGKYQSTRDGKTLVWNSDPRPGDAVTWSGDRDRNDYAKGFGRLIWYTLERGSDKPQLYARYWGRMVNGRFDGPVNVHAKKKTRYAIFVDGKRVTGWTLGTAPSTAVARWRRLAATRHQSNAELVSNDNATSEFSKIRFRPGPSDGGTQSAEPAAPATGPDGEDAPRVTSPMAESDESIRGIYTDRRPMIDIDESLQLLAFPPRRLRR